MGVSIRGGILKPVFVTREFCSNLDCVRKTVLQMTRCPSRPGVPLAEQRNQFDLGARFGTFWFYVHVSHHVLRCIQLTSTIDQSRKDQQNDCLLLVICHTLGTVRAFLLWTTPSHGLIVFGLRFGNAGGVPVVLDAMIIDETLG